MLNDVAIQEPKNEVAVIFSKITEGLQAFEDRKAAFAELVQEAAQVKKTTVEDRSPLKKAIEIRKKIKAARVQVEKEGKSLRDPLTNVTKEISAKQKELVDIVSPAEDEMQAIEDWYAAEDDRIKREDEEKEKARIQARIDRLAAYGYQIDYNMLISLSDQDFDRIVENAKVEHEREEKAKAEKEEADRKQREQDEADRRELQVLREKQAEADRVLREREEEIARKEAAIKAEEERRRQEKENAERQAFKRRLDARIDQMVGIGLRWHEGNQNYEGYGVFVAMVDMKVLPDDKWDEVINNIQPIIRNAKLEEAAKIEAEEREREEKRQAELERIKKQAAAQALQEQKDRESEAKRQEEERLAQASDKDKFVILAGYYENLPKIEPKSAKHKKLYAEVVELNAKIIAHINAKA